MVNMLMMMMSHIEFCPSEDCTGMCVHNFANRVLWQDDNDNDNDYDDVDDDNDDDDVEDDDDDDIELQRQAVLPNQDFHLISNTIIIQ